MRSIVLFSWYIWKNFPNVPLISVVSPILPTNRKFSTGFFKPYFYFPIFRKIKRICYPSKLGNES
ncbi:hypothetical protein LEP1GSC133_0872 [Leptospira borgpetersenii serovar Pomona str. 200901868]|uniref:Uncharacterized protein n=1 Tax=Leptospira borgpetersenii serovar Pomona str. 200901868 TaxID=1192866 RepID=M6WG69_LEPBO|nr:hypothetical protein LEP1GSC133_0872 [Leptospira borgpetersenii serovar Pomona str. 200901868]